MVFLTDLYKYGLGYTSVMLTAQIALNNIIILPSYPDMSEHPKHIYLFLE